jgi:two-component system CheB/CheR fusion protein
MTDTVVEQDFDALLEYLQRSRGFDFSGYKRPSLMRRVQKRMEHVNVESFSEYTDYLEVHPDEFAELFNVILINVTSFFRDESSWTYLRETVLPEMLASRPAAEVIRVWSAGCASGEEAYSVAMILAEALGREQFRDRVKIYATDADEGALNQARAASYAEKHIEGVPPPLLQAYFSREGDRFVFDKQIRRSMIFGRHDLVQDAPISRVSLLICRNTLMYFNAEVQSNVMSRFHFGLRDDGVLFLGKAEMLLTQPRLFTPIDLKRRIFRKVVKDGWRKWVTNVTHAGGDEIGANHDARIYATAFEASSNAQLVIDHAGVLSLYNEHARALFNIAPSDLGRPVYDLELSSRPVDLRSVIQQALEERRTVTLKDVEWEISGRETRYFDVHLAPLFASGGDSIGISISFVDVSRQQELQHQLTRSKQDLETAQEELQSTNEELETTNEELQSSVEELETTNEELQSTNEELETMNEELQSTNEELQTINEEMRQRGEELNSVNSFLESILTGVRSGVVVVDRELHVTAWNHRSEDLWGLRADEVRNQNFLNLDIGLPTEKLRPTIRECLNGDGDHQELTLPATNRRGRTIDCKVTSTPLLGPDRRVRGVILMMDELVRPVTTH